MHKSRTLSIVTPTYNRANLLTTCYTSLCRQTVKDFEWIIVDDGSRDDTEAMVKTFDTADFPVIYVKKENAGKHTALNESHAHINGKYVLILDSDDYLTEDAVESILGGWQRFREDSGVGVIRFARQAKDGRLCAYGKEEYLPTDMLRDQRIRVISGDSCEVIRAELFRKYPFPVFEGERFLAETALWYRVGMKAACVYINKGIYVCEYLDGGLTRSGKKLQISNPKGGMYNSELRMNRRCLLRERIKAGLLYCCYGFFAEKVTKDIFREAKYKSLTAMCLLPGWLIYLIWKRKL